jgi:hypothetical protein
MALYNSSDHNTDRGEHVEVDAFLSLVIVFLVVASYALFYLKPHWLLGDGTMYASGCSFVFLTCRNQQVTNDFRDRSKIMTYIQMFGE